MGLDMWVYRASRLTDKELASIEGLPLNEMWSKDIHTFVISEMEEEDKPMYADIIPLCRITTTDASYWNVAKIKEDLGVNPDADAYISYISYKDDGVDIGLSVIGKEEIKYLRGINGEDYTIHKQEKTYVVKMKELAYWRKHYELQQALYDDYFSGVGHSIINCGYHKLNRAMFNDIIRMDGQKQLKGKRYTDKLFYHEWY